MPESPTLVRVLKSTLATLVLLALLGATAATAQATNGTIKAIKGGDRKVGETSNRTYALPTAGARFEYTTSEAKAEDPASSGWTAFPSTTGADGTATVSVPAGTYYVREQSVPGGFSGFGPVKSLFYDPSSDVPAAARPYVAKVVVTNGQTTEAYPNRSASSDADDWDSTSGGDKGSPFVNVRDNQTFPNSCGINILMVLDRSGSIGPFKSVYRDAAKAFVNALDGTPTQIGILSFSAGDSGVSSYQDGSGSPSLTHSPLDLGVAGNAGTLKGTIDSVYDNPSGGTNWDRALQKASQAKGFVNNAATGQTTNPDVVVFITDGNPTARSTDGSDSGSDVDLIDLTAGMSSANLVKSQAARAGTKLKLYALGVGSGVTPGNLKTVSGPVLGEDYETPTIAELTAKLTELAARTCGARVFVRKRLAGSSAAQPNWGFSASSNGGAISYLDGNPRTHAASSGTVETGVILTRLPAGGREVTVTEDSAGQPLGGFKLDGVACNSGSYDGAPVAPVATTAMGVKLSVGRGSTIYCTFTNTKLNPMIDLDKQVRVLDSGEFVDQGLRAHVGDTLEYRFLVTDGESNTPIHTVQFDDPRCDAGTISGPVGDDGDALLEDGETWTYTCSHVVTEADPNPLPNTARVTGRDELGSEVGDEDSTWVEILKPGTLVVKDGNQLAYPGDTVTFTFAVTNSGNAPLSDVSVTDDRCAPVTGPTQKLDGDQDGLLEVGEKWIFTCSKQIPPGHKIGDENPIRNVATATAKDPLGATVSAQDDHLVRVLHPAVDIEKTGPATAVLGTALAYTLTVTNPGDVPFASQQVVVSDSRCEAPPAGPDTGGDQTPGQLDPGDRWTYTCTAQTAGQPAGTFVNTASVTARDFNGRTVSDTDELPTVLETQQVLPQREIVNGTARLRGPSGCVRKRFRATVRGSRIAQVTFYRDGKRIKRIVAEPGQRTFSVGVKPGRKQGVHRITAKVRFKAPSRTRTRTLRLSYQRCRKQILRPRFTG